MGNYTELIFGATLKKDTPKEVIKVLLSMVECTYDHDKSVFDFGRNVLSGGSYYFGVSDSCTHFYKDKMTQQWILSSRANCKNYDNDIKKFLDWILPYIEKGSSNREMYAIVIYEQSDEPTIYYLRD